MIEKLLCLFGFHDREVIPSKSRPPVFMLINDITDGWQCSRCNKKQEPIEWELPKPKRKPKSKPKRKPRKKAKK
jgi:hypothetical protein